MARYHYLAIILNFIVNFLLLMGTGRLSGSSAKPGRYALGAALGAVYTAACLGVGGLRLGQLPGRLFSIGMMGLAAFGWGGDGLKRIGLFGLLTVALEGLASSLGREHGASLPLAAALVWLLCRMAFPEGAVRREYRQVILRRGDKEQKVLALRDTGNTLRDPVTGESVLIVSGEVGRALTGMTREELSAPLDTMLRHPIPGLRLIPYRAIGQDGGLLLALPMEDVRIDRWRGRALVAFAPTGLEPNQALIGG